MDFIKKSVGTSRRNYFSAGLVGIALLVCLSAFGADGAATTAPQKIFQWRPFLAPFHSVVLHFPIGFLTAAFLLEIYCLFRPSTELRRVTLLIVWLSLLSGIASAALGLLRADAGDYNIQALQMHRLFGLAVPGITLVTLIFQHLSFRNQTHRGWNFGYRGLLCSTMALLMIAGHMGGNLTHGSGYLTQNAPGFVRDLLEEETAAAPEATTAELDEKQKFYVEKVQPIFTSKCVSCHGSEKQKGGYRLDLPELALKTGKSGQPAIVPGDPTESQLVRRILLPQQSDDAMPPEGKQPLAMDEIATILDWIKAGAAIPSSIANTVTTNFIVPSNAIVSTNIVAPARLGPKGI